MLVFVGLLGGREAALVDAVVDGVLYLFVHGLYVFCFVGGEQRLRGLA